MLARRRAVGLAGALALPSLARAQGRGPDDWLQPSGVSAYRTKLAI